MGHSHPATQITLTDTSSTDANITAATQITRTDTSSADTNITATTQITLSDTSSADTKITAAPQITLSDTSSADTNIIAATQITLTDTSSADTDKTATTQITLSDTSSANTNITAATQITHTDTSSADTNITAATQITLTDTSSANTNITTATQITHTDTSSANTDITAATQITLTDTSSANTDITAATQITHTDTSSADTNIIAATNSPLDTLSGPLQTHSPLWRALRRTRGRLRTVADGCDRKRKTWRTQPHPQTPKWNGNPRYAFGKKSPGCCSSATAAAAHSGTTEARRLTGFGGMNTTCEKLFLGQGTKNGDLLDRCFHFFFEFERSIGSKKSTCSQKARWGLRRRTRPKRTQRSRVWVGEMDDQTGSTISIHICKGSYHDISWHIHTSTIHLSVCLLTSLCCPFDFPEFDTGAFGWEGPKVAVVERQTLWRETKVWSCGAAKGRDVTWTSHGSLKAKVSCDAKFLADL